MPPCAAAPDPYQPKSYVQFQHAEWTKNASIYQINTRQFTPEGTFRAAERELPRLKALGVDILWLMPIHPIGAVKRKGTLGSLPYAVRDHLAVNPEFGTLDDFKYFVAAAHAQGLHVILDWVGNHTSWDNVLRAPAIPSGTRKTARASRIQRRGTTGTTSSTSITTSPACAAT
jgi:1,4-alpha-glucan branching enzyme